MGKPVPGLWQAEWQCGSCGAVVRKGKSLRTQIAYAFVRHRRCKAVYMGRPKNTCGWQMSFVFIWVPPGGRGS